MQIQNSTTESTGTSVTTTVPSFAFIGGFGAGKTYHCNQMKELLEQNFNVKIHKVSISAKIKELAIDLFGMQEKDRRLLQQLANKMCEINPCVWSEYLAADVKKNNKVPFVIDDIRFVSDAEVLKRNVPNLVIIRIETSEEQRMQIYEKLYGRRPTNEELNDPTEANIASINADITIQNGYNPENTKKQLQEIIKSIQNEKLLRKS